MSIQPVHNKVPACCIGVAGQGIVQPIGEVFFGPCVSDQGNDFPGYNIHAGQQCLRTVSSVLKLSSFNLTRPDRFSLVYRFQGLNARFFVEENGANTLFRPDKGLMIGVANIGAVYFKRLIPWAFDPAFNLVGTNVGLILKNAPPASER